MRRAAYALQRAIALIHSRSFINQHRLNPTAFTRSRKLSLAIVASTLIHWFSPTSVNVVAGFALFTDSELLASFKMGQLTLLQKMQVTQD